MAFTWCSRAESKTPDRKEKKERGKRYADGERVLGRPCAELRRAGRHPTHAEAYEKTAACFKKYLKPTDTVLDFACGTGIVTFAVAPSVQSVRAIDVSGEMVRRAQEKVKAQGVENVTVTQTDLFDGCLAEESFNAVLACNVLLYIEDRSAALARIRALLKPQGTLLLVSDCLGEGLTRERVRKWFEYKTGKRPYVAFDTMPLARTVGCRRGVRGAGAGESLSRAAEFVPCGEKGINAQNVKTPHTVLKRCAGSFLLLLPAGNFVEQLFRHSGTSARRSEDPAALRQTRRSGSGRTGTAATGR